MAGGSLGAKHAWREARLAQYTPGATHSYHCGLPGVLLAGLVLTLQEPPRGASERKAVTQVDSVGTTLAMLFRTRGFVTLLCGYAIFTIATHARSMWIPGFLVRVHHLPV